jgi:hypothetical protein
LSASASTCTALGIRREVDRPRDWRAESRADAGTGDCESGVLDTEVEVAYRCGSGVGVTE